ncbi:MAG: radical SAM protein [Clostridia bacterium]|nr:radical SAM protein [Clostridia bacterium]
MKKYVYPYKIFTNEKVMYHFNVDKLYITEVNNNHLDLLNKLAQFDYEEVQANILDEEQKQCLNDLIEFEMITDEQPNIKEPTVVCKPTSYRIVLTEQCNLACVECFATKNINCLKTMDSETLFEVLEYSFKNNNNKSTQYCFFGGEPLIKFDLIKEAVAKIEEAEKNHLVKNPVLLITTNGTILNDEIIDFFIDHNVRVGVSIDGPKEIHDKLRPYKDLRGTFDDVKENYMKMYNKGVNLHVLITPNPDFLGNLKDIVKYVLENFPMKELTINTPFKYDTLQWSVDGEKYAHILFDIYKLTQEFGVILDSALSVVLGSISNGIRRQTPCSILGDEFMTLVTPHGEMSRCAQKYDSQISLGNIKNVSVSDNCKNCYAYGFCGGVCPAYKVLSGMSTDSNKCKFMHAILPNLINYLKMFEETSDDLQ